MFLPFSTDQFFDVFRAYNAAVWPMQWVLNGLGIITAGLLLRGRSADIRLVAAGLAFLWAWSGVVYHVVFFRKINPAAWVFGIMFVAAALWLVWSGVVGVQKYRSKTGTPMAIAGWALIAYALVIYPVLGYAFGHRFPAVPTFALPCPTTIFTIGVLIIAGNCYPRSFLIVPLAWTVVGSVAAFKLGVLQDVGLIVAGISGLVALFPSGRHA